MALTPKSKLARFIAGKGFYIALALLVVGAGTTAWVAVDRAVGGLESSVPEALESEQSVPFEEAGESVSGLPRDGQSEFSAAPDSEQSQSPDWQPEDASSASGKEPGALSISYVLPLAGDVINPYSVGELVKSRTLGDWRTHDGVDLAAESAEPVAAVAQGVVAEIYDDPMFGTTVVVEHPNGVSSIYQSLNPAVAVSVGQSVSAGDTLGSVGDTALAECALETHLHFAMKRDGEFLDPFAEIGVYGN